MINIDTVEVGDLFEISIPPGNVLGFNYMGKPDGNKSFFCKIISREKNKFSISLDNLNVGYKTPYKLYFHLCDLERFHKRKPRRCNKC